MEQYSEVMLMSGETVGGHTLRRFSSLAVGCVMFERLNCDHKVSRVGTLMYHS
jgi:hypothetical protein